MRSPLTDIRIVTEMNTFNGICQGEPGLAGNKIKGILEILC